MKAYYCRCGGKQFVLGAVFYENNESARDDRWYQKGFFKRPPFSGGTLIEQKRNGKGWVPIVQRWVCRQCGTEAIFDELKLKEE